MRTSADLNTSIFSIFSLVVQRHHGEPATPGSRQTGNHMDFYSLLLCPHVDGPWLTLDKQLCWSGFFFLLWKIWDFFSHCKLNLKHHLSRLRLSNGIIIAIISSIFIIIVINDNYNNHSNNNKKSRFLYLCFNTIFSCFCFVSIFATMLWTKMKDFKPSNRLDANASRNRLDSRHRQSESGERMSWCSYANMSMGTVQIPFPEDCALSLKIDEIVLRAQLPALCAVIHMDLTTNLFLEDAKVKTFLDTSASWTPPAGCWWAT